MRSPGRRVSGRARRVAAVTAYVVLLGTWVVTLGIPNDSLQVVLWLWAATIAARFDAPWRSHLAFLRDWWLPVAGLVVYFYSRGLTDELGLPVHVEMPITLDRWLGGGVTPTERLQAAWCGDPCVKESDPRLFDLYFTSVYATHFVAGLTIAAVLWSRSRAEWERWMRRYVGICFGALVVYIAFPMAPPWMASEMGELGHTSRITGRGWSEIGLDRIDVLLQGVGNPVAAMPSLHAGIAFLIAMYGVQRLRSPGRWLLLVYPASMSVALVYYAEHYVVDIVAGALLAWAVLVGASRWERRRQGST
ncbi:phosphatase PAP2 family protein [Nocardioides sediminis]|uniref:phosphatase PAP2 family protein n=1 Tax=Nocardioides sediminis TaxID=433648 RepID=UPI00131F2937|nr:phosphatase PAP2 family protein [Nocardioides sediminis]